MPAAPTPPAPSELNPFLGGARSLGVIENPAAGASTGMVAQEQPPKTDQPVITKRAFLEGHTGEYVRCVAFSSDGKTLASGSDDTTVKLWNVATGKEKATLRGHTDEVWFVAFLPDGKTVVSGSLDGSVRLWDIAAARQKGSLRCFVPSTEYTRTPSLAISPDGKTLAVVANEKEVKLLDLQSRKERRRFQGDWESVVFSRDGKTLALVGVTGVELRDPASGEEKITLKGDSFGWVAFSPDDKTLAVEVDEGKEGLQDLFVKLVEVATARSRASFRVYSEEEGIMSLAFSPDGKTLAVGRYLDGLQLWDVTTRKLKADVPPAADTADNTQFAVSLTFSPDGKILAAGGSTTTGLQQEKGIVKLWNVAGKP